MSSTSSTPDESGSLPDSTTVASDDSHEAPLIAVARDKFYTDQTGWLWTRTPGALPPYEVVPLSVAMVTGYPTDAHFVSHVVVRDGVPVRNQPRLTKAGDSLRLIRPRGFEAHHYVLVSDVDTPGHQPITAEQIEDAKLKLSKLSTILWYTSRGGLRIIQPLTKGITPEHYEAVLPAWLDELQAVLGSEWVVDRACADWTRHFRLPYVIRDGDRTTPVLHIGGSAIECPPMPPPAPEPVRRVQPRTVPRPSGGVVAERARRYAATIEVPTCGTSSCDAALWNVALHVAKGFSLDEGTAIDIVTEWASASHHGWKEKDIARKVQDAKASSHLEEGFHLRNERPSRSPTILTSGGGLGIDEHGEENGYDGPGDGGSGSNNAAPAAGDASESGGPPGDGEPSTEQPDARVTIQLGTDLERITNEAIGVLAMYDPNSYQRGMELVRVVRTDRREESGVDRPEGHARIIGIPAATLQERLSSLAKWETFNAKAGWVPTIPPERTIRALMARAVWEGIPSLTGIVETPVMRPNGTILDRPGYDWESGLLYVPTFDPLPVVEAPTLDDANVAVSELLEVVWDFPFEGDAHRAVWLAGVLTPFSMPAVSSPAPMFLADANVRGAGKTLLWDTVSTILYGRPFAKMAHITDEAELEKRITSIALSGDSAVLIDNIRGPFGGKVWEAALTSRSWKGRRLGFSEDLVLPLNVVWFATGNNVEVSGDMTRRILHVRLRSQEERPEDRADLRHPDLLGWIRQNRPRLVRAALTILRAYIVAGRPQQKVRLGGFDSWASLVPSALVWLGLPDPCSTREGMEQSGTSDTSTLRALLSEWKKVFGADGKTVAEVLRFVATKPNTDVSDISMEDGGPYVGLRQAIMAFCPGKEGKLPSGVSFGKRLGHFRQRNVGGQWFDHGSQDRTNVVAWVVRSREANTGDAGDAGDAGAIFSHAEVGKSPVPEHVSTSRTSTGLISTRDRLDSTPASPASPASGSVEVTSADLDASETTPASPASPAPGRRPSEPHTFCPGMAMTLDEV